MEKFENNIIADAYYLIHKFNANSREVTNLQIQKLMYFFEAYYMNIYNTDNLYECNFCAWAFGPVAIPLYKEFRKYESKNYLSIVINIFILYVNNIKDICKCTYTYLSS